MHWHDILGCTWEISTDVIQPPPRWAARELQPHHHTTSFESWQASFPAHDKELCWSEAWFCKSVADGCCYNSSLTVVWSGLQLDASSQDVGAKERANLCSWSYSSMATTLLPTIWPYGKGKGHGKGKGKKGKRPVNVLPKELQNRDNVATDSHGRRLCFNYNLNKCSSKTPHGGQCDRGYHLCMRKDCHAPHPEFDHGKSKNAWQCKRISELATAGVSLSDCLIIEIFAGIGRVTASLKQLGLHSAFGVAHARSKQAAAQIVMCDFCTASGQDLLWSWLQNPFVVGIFLAPSCGSASRARQIPLRQRFNYRGRHRARHGPAPLRTDLHPNGVPGLSETNLRRASLANTLCHLTATLVRWACEVGCIVCVENPQYSLFWATTFWLEVANLVSYTVFHFCQYGSLRKKRTTLAINAEEFNVISNRCGGQNSKHKHAAWGISSSTNKFATSEETAYPMGLAKLIAHCYVLALHRLQIQTPRRQSMISVTHRWKHSGSYVQLQVFSQNHLSCLPWCERTLKSFVSKLHILLTSCFNVQVNQLL